VRRIPPLYAILDVETCAARGLDPLAVADAFLRGGARLLQLRFKSGSSAAFLDLADALVARTRAHGALLIINDRADVAAAAGASGVHVGQGDLPAAAACAILGEDAIVGLSTHDEAQVDAALASPASYVAVGPIFETATKATGYAARGLDLVRYAAGRGKAVVAIGGVTLDRAPAVLGAGADAVAVISDLLDGQNAEARTRAFVDACRGYRGV
jgi:thiamine-phosphate pyrophosphorylase